MKQTKIMMSCLVCSLILSGCAKEVEPVNQETGKTPTDVPAGAYELDASIEVMTKTSLDDLTLSWEADDVIKVWTGEAFTDYIHDGDGKFKGEKPAVMKDGKYLAFYPSASLNGTAATFEIPTEQVFAAKKANDLPMVAVWETEGNCVFSPVCSILEMPLTVASEISLKSIDYSFNGNVGSGSYTYDYVSGAYSKDVAGNITLTGTFASGNVYNAVVPGDYSDGFTITLTDTDNCAMILTATNGGELKAGSVQPLGAVSYEQLAPIFLISYDEWAATASLTFTPGQGTKYWLSKTVNGEPLTGVEPVDMSSLSVGAAVKLYGYLCSENVAATGVVSGDDLYLVTEYIDGNKKYMRSVKYTYYPDPLERIIYADAPVVGVTLSGSVTKTKEFTASYSDDKVAGYYCIKIDATPEWAELFFTLWDYDTKDYWDLSNQSQDYYNFEFYFKADSEISGNVGLTTQIVKEGEGYYTSTSQTAWQNYTSEPGTKIPANTWTKISIPLNEIWFSGDNVLPDEYQGYYSNGSRTQFLSNYDKFGRFYLHQQYKEGQPRVWYIDHMVIRKGTINK